MSTASIAVPRPTRALSAATACAILLVGVLVRLGYLVLIYRDAGSLSLPDSQIYEDYAARLLGQCPPLDSCAALDVTQRMPGYPLFLAAIRLVFGNDPLWAVLAQLLIDAGTCLLIAWLAALIDRRLALAAGLLAAVNLNMITTAAAILTESLFLPAFVAGLIAALLYFEAPSARRALAAGLALGLALMLRSVMQFFLPVLIGALAIAAWHHRVPLRRASAHFALATLATLLVVSPILARNISGYGYPALISQGGRHSLFWAAPAAREFALGTPFAQGQVEMNDRLAKLLAEEHRVAMPDNPFAAADIMERAASRALWTLGLGGLAEAWIAGAVINLMAPALVAVPAVAAQERPHFYDIAGQGALDKISNYLRATAGSLFFWEMAPAVLWTTLARLLEILALFRIGRPRGLKRGPSLYLLATAVYFLAITGPVTGVKYRLPLEPLLIILLAESLVWLYERGRGPSLSPAHPAA